MSHYQPYTFTPTPGGTLQQGAAPSREGEPTAPSRHGEPITPAPPLVRPPDIEPHGLPPAPPPAPPAALDSEEPVAGPPAVPVHGLRTEPQPVYSPQADVPVPPSYLPFPTTVLKSVPEGSTYAGLPAYPTGASASADRSQFSFTSFEHPKGTTVLALGILGILFQPLAIAAWVMGSRAKKQITAGQYAPTSFVSIGRVLGIIGTILFILLSLLAIALIIWLLISGENILDWFR